MEDLEKLEQLARQGDSQSQVRLGFAYASGDGVARDPHAAISWYEKAAFQGELVAQYNLADMCLARGEFEKAHYWFLEAARQGDADAQFNLAMIYERGLGVEQSDAQAFAWYKLAAENGSARAQYDLGLMYWQGRGANRDIDAAKLWLGKAEASGVPKASQVLASLADF